MACSCSNCGSSQEDCCCDDPCFEEEYTLIKTHRYQQPVGPCDENCNSGLDSAPKQEPEYDEIQSSAVIAEVGGKFKIFVPNPCVYTIGQWLYIKGYGKFSITSIDADCACPSLTLENDCDGNETAISDNAAPGSTIPAGTPFWPVDPPVCAEEAEEFCEQVKGCEDAQCDSLAREWGAGEGVPSIIVCTSDGREVLQPPADLSNPIIVGEDGVWVVKNLEEIICNTVRDVCGGDCTPGEVVTPFLTSGSLVIPAGVTQVVIELWGGGGGSDSAGQAGPGGYTRAVIDIGNCGLVSGAILGIIVGGGGLPPGSSVNPAWTAAGGNPGFGGQGVDTGSGGWAGGGGGSFAFVTNAPVLPNSKTDVIAVAGGGGGGNGGGGPTVNGTSGNNAVVTNPGTMEGAGAGAGNAGAGGGGYIGGAAGNGGQGFLCASADASSQISFTNLVVAPGPVAPEGTGSANYVAGRGNAAVQAGSGDDDGKGGDGLGAVTLITECP